MIDTLKKIRLCWTEEQEIFQRLYRAIFTPECPIEVISSLEFGNHEETRGIVSNLKPDILLIGCKFISSELIHEISKFQTECPKTGIVLLVSLLKHDDVKTIKQYIENTRSAFGFMFKKSLTRTEQLYSIISLVNMGQVIIDPTLGKLFSKNNEKVASSKGLTAREMEILNLVAKGYTNVAISDTLCIDVKTVRHHINNIYSKLKTSDEFDNKHPRVSATNVYHRLTGQLSFEDNVFDG
jgi:DNA-binding NarL/FixJ family response regulator